MTLLEMILMSMLFAIYIVCLFTVVGITFRNGHWILGILGFVFPIFWLIGVVLPPTVSAVLEE
jgi:uncharacterized membrane protein